jgi:hypothetical protein
MQTEKTINNELADRAAGWMANTNPGVENWVIGESKGVKRSTFNKEMQRSEGLPDGVVVPILCQHCTSPIAHYSEEPSE